MGRGRTTVAPASRYLTSGWGRKPGKVEGLGELVNTELPIHTFIVRWREATQSETELPAHTGHIRHKQSFGCLRVKKYTI